jgi:hypothetical protein
MKITGNKMIQERSDFYDLCFWPCPYDPMQTEFVGFVKVSGGIKHLVNQYKRINSLDALKETHECGFFSPRPYQLGQACDGSITACVLALFYRFCQERGHFPNTLLKAAYPKQNLQPGWAHIIASADWQGVAYPKQWDANAMAGLLKSLREINYSSLVGVVSDLIEKEARHERTK